MASDLDIYVCPDGECDWFLVEKFEGTEEQARARALELEGKSGVLTAIYADAFRLWEMAGFGKVRVDVCRFCGSPSRVDPSDQRTPPDYCHPEDHGETE